MTASVAAAAIVAGPDHGHRNREPPRAEAEAEAEADDGSGTGIGAGQSGACAGVCAPQNSATSAAVGRAAGSFARVRSIRSQTNSGHPARSGAWFRMRWLTATWSPVPNG